MYESGLYNKNPKVSVIIPVYNAEEHLEQCINSMISQSYRNLEIVLVDDGSNDNCGMLCDDYAKKDKRIIAIHKSNEGVSEARNTGIKAAAGEFICFLDSDDYVENNLIENAVNNAVQHLCDIVIWGFYLDYFDKWGSRVKTSVYHTGINGIYSKSSFKELPLNYQFINCLGYVWNKMYHKRLLKNNQIIFNKDISISEDLLFNADVFSLSGNLGFIDKPFTHYTQRNTSLGKRYYPNYFEIKMNISNSLVTLFKSWEIDQKKIDRSITHFGLKSITGTISNISSSKNNTIKEKIKLLNELLNKKEVNEILVEAELLKFNNNIIRFLLKKRLCAFLILSVSIINYLKHNLMLFILTDKRNEPKSSYQYYSSGLQY